MRLPPAHRGSAHSLEPLHRVVNVLQVDDICHVVVDLRCIGEAQGGVGHGPVEGGLRQGEVDVVARLHGEVADEHTQGDPAGRGGNEGRRVEVGRRGNGRGTTVDREGDRGKDRKGGREKEREGEKKRGREREREGGREGEREGGREGVKEGGKRLIQVTARETKTLAYNQTIDVQR